MFGPLELNIAHTIDEALNTFAITAQWHQQCWSDTSEGSGLDSPHFVNFHNDLIRQALLRQEIKLIKVTAGNRTLGYLYCFSFHNKIYFYLSSVNYAISDNKLKPGLVSHYLAIQHFKSLGYDSYDFIGGEALYKQSLSTVSYPLAMLSINKPTLRYKFEALARCVKNTCTKGIRKVAIVNSIKTVKD
ncbi:MAG: CelD/BcsL family acetyltransferase involved in cellulose biosynthesis [Paraglaciecola sp.]|jgi:CelD/BcsL family acetyltransferase involved in cellulose biosynthesis